MFLVLWFCANVLCRVVHPGPALLPRGLGLQEGGGHLQHLPALLPGGVPDRGGLLDGCSWHRLHRPGQQPHGVRLQVHQEQQDPVQETGRGQVHLCALKNFKRRKSREIIFHVLIL